MTNRQIMLNTLKKYTLSALLEQGFTGKYPNFRRYLGDCIELITFQTNKWGGSFTVEVSAVFPNAKNPNYELYDGVTEETFGVEATNDRYRLPGMYCGWFFYRDIYRIRTPFFRNIYYDINEKEAVDFIPPKGYKLVQKFDNDTAVRICMEVNKQFKAAFKWLADFERKEGEKKK